MQIPNYTKHRQNNPCTGIGCADFDDKNGLEGVYQYRSAPFTSRKPTQQGCSPCWVNVAKNIHYERSKNYTRRTAYTRTHENEKNAPPPTDTSVVGNVTKYHNLDGAHTFRHGQEVVIATERHDRKHFDGRLGTVAAVIYPNDPNRSVVYVRVGKASPCFYPCELTLVSKSVGEVVA